MIDYNAVVKRVYRTIPKFGRQRVSCNHFSANNLSQPVYSLVNELSRQSSIHAIRFAISQKLCKCVETTGIEDVYKDLTCL